MKYLDNKCTQVFDWTNCCVEGDAMGTGKGLLLGVSRDTSWPLLLLNVSHCQIFDFDLFDIQQNTNTLNSFVKH